MVHKYSEAIHPSSSTAAHDIVLIAYSCTLLFDPQPQYVAIALLAALTDSGAGKAPGFADPRYGRRRTVFLGRRLKRSFQ